MNGRSHDMSAASSPEPVLRARPLSGLRVLSLAEQLPGPYATLLLADMGAEVVQIERPVTGDPARVFPDYYASISRNKKSVCLNLKSTDDREKFFALVRDADVVLEGFSPGTADRMGVGWSTLREINPRLVYLSISGFGQTGPHRDRPAHDLSFQAIAGVLSGVAPGSAAPTVPLGDMTAATFAALGVVTALLARERDQQGTYVDVAMADCLVSWMTPFIVPALNGGAPIDVMLSPGYGIFECADGLALALSIAHEDHFWRRLCLLMSMEDVADASHAERVQRRELMRSMIAEGFKGRTREEWAAALDSTGVPWAPVHALHEVPGDPQVSSRGLFEAVQDSSGESSWHVRQPIRFEGFESVALTAAPTLGQHQDAVVKDGS
jgi:crotonobetainyl-CoA:carnitine CoA-transferase CaiB-like acyl-CoA transferase